MALIKSGPFKGYKKNHFKVILADPAWVFQTRSKKGKGRSPETHYRCMTLDEIKALPVQDLAAKDCALFMWVIDTHLPQAREVMEAWGFEYKTVGFYWVKTNKDGSPFTGMGYWTRANPEQCQFAVSAETAEDGHQCLLAAQGRPKRKAMNVPRLIMAKRREHSRKPDETHERIEALLDGPYIELFARQTRAGWSSWGDESNKFDATENAATNFDDIFGDSSNTTADDLLGDSPIAQPTLSVSELLGF